MPRKARAGGWGKGDRRAGQSQIAGATEVASTVPPKRTREQTYHNLCFAFLIDGRAVGVQREAMGTVLRRGAHLRSPSNSAGDALERVRKAALAAARARTRLKLEAYAAARPVVARLLAIL